MSLLQSIPGYADAVLQEQMVRELAFMTAPLPICGVPIRHMNARHYMILSWCRNRFIAGREVPQAEDLAFFLWCLSPQYTLNLADRTAFIQGTVLSLSFKEAAVECAKYLETVWADWPQGGGTERQQYTAPIASIVDILAREYGWADEAILEMPLARVFQYLRRLEMRQNPKAIMFNRSDRVIRQHLAAQQGS